MNYISRALYLFAICCNTEAFAPSRTASILNLNANQVSTLNSRGPSIQSSCSGIHSSSTSLGAFHNDSGGLVLAAAEGWRQYVPLVVICGVLLDIVLGSPLANTALAPMKRASGVGEEDSKDGDSNNSNPFKKNPKERVDTDAIAEATLQRARYSMELRNFLDENKTDEQKYEEMRKKIDQQATQLENNLDNIK